MEARESRHWLRIESGARQGKQVPLSPRGLTIGRKSGNQLVLADGSVSGQHAEIRLDGSDYVLTDLGSTNGTRVAGAKVESHRLAHGDRFSLGNVELSFLDGSLAAPEPDAGGAVSRIDADRVAAAGKRGVLGLLVVLLLAVGAVAAWWFLGRGEDGPTVAPVAEVPGNLLERGTFEGRAGDAAWESVAGAPQGFYADPEFAATGAMGFGVFLEAEEWAEAVTDGLVLRPRQAYRLEATILAEDGATGRIGLRLASTSGAGPEFTAWTRTVRNTADFEGLELVCAGLPGYDRARIVVAAAADQPGVVLVDDVSLVAEDAPASARVAAQGAEARLFGGEATTAAFVRSGRVLCPGIDFAPWRNGDRTGWTQGTWRAALEDRGFAFTAAGAPPDARLAFTVYAEDRGGGDVLLAAVGPTGYRPLTGEFEVAEATDLLVGQGVDLVRFHFDAPLASEGVVRDGALRVQVAMAGTSTLHLQYSFVDERTRARQLADQAAEYESHGEFGAALETWSTLLDEVPFDAELVGRAEAAHARLVQAGMERVDTIRAEVERARFFALAELFRQCRTRAVTLGDSYRRTVVAEEVATLVGEIDGDLAGLALDAPQEHRVKLAAVLAALKEDESPDLAAHIRAVLGEDETGNRND